MGWLVFLVQVIISVFKIEEIKRKSIVMIPNYFSIIETLQSIRDVEIPLTRGFNVCKSSDLVTFG